MSLRRRKMTIPCTVKLRQAQALSMQPVEFVYDVTDPFRIQLVVASPMGARHSWSISRELLAEGCEEPQTQGRVKVWPDAAQFRIDFTDDRGTVSFAGLLLSARVFLDQTYRMVGSEVESPRADMLPEVERAVDEALAVLLQGAS